MFPIKRKILLGVCWLISISGTVLAQELTDEQIQYKLDKELSSLESQGATIRDVMSVFINFKRNKYLLSKEEYYRVNRFYKYVSYKTTERKILDGTFTHEDQERQEKQNERYKTYQEYLEFKQTEKAKSVWENNINDSILKLVVNNVKQLTPNEQTKQQELTSFLNNRSFIKSVLVTDGKDTKEIKLIEDGKLVETFNESD